jgi:hypothetical protein
MSRPVIKVARSAEEQLALKSLMRKIYGTPIGRAHERLARTLEGLFWTVLAVGFIVLCLYVVEFVQHVTRDLSFEWRMRLGRLGTIIEFSWLFVIVVIFPIMMWMGRPRTWDPIARKWKWK